MHLTTRIEENRRVRVVAWSAASTSDLGAVLVLAGLTFACPALILAAAHTSGVIRVVCIVLAVVTGIYWTLTAVSVFMVAVGIYVVRALAAETPTRAQQASFVVPPVVLGAVLGVGTYESGPAALVIGPIVAGAFVAVARPRMSSRRSKARVTALSCLGAVVAIGIGSTIFL